MRGERGGGLVDWEGYEGATSLLFVLKSDGVVFIIRSLVILSRVLPFSPGLMPGLDSRSALRLKLNVDSGSPSTLS